MLLFIYRFRWSLCNFCQRDQSMIHVNRFNFFFFHKIQNPTRNLRVMVVLGSQVSTFRICNRIISGKGIEMNTRPTSALSLRMESKLHLLWTDNIVWANFNGSWANSASHTIEQKTLYLIQHLHPTSYTRRNMQSPLAVKSRHPFLFVAVIDSLAAAVANNIDA